MPMSPGDALDLVKVYLPEWRKATEATEKIDRWYRNRLRPVDRPAMPKRPTREYRDLRDMAVTPWLRFVVRSLTQILYVEGYRGSDGENASAWSAWQANGLDSRQIGIHRAAIAHALAYVTVIPGDPFPVIRGVSARKMVAFYQDPATDDWPMYALAGSPIVGADGRAAMRFRLYDDAAVYTLDARNADGEKLTFVTYEEHNAGECPVVRYANELDLDGRAEGEVEPFVELASRINQDTFDRLVVQRFGAWVVRYATGLVEPETDEERHALKLKLGIEDVLVTENPDARFGTLAPTPIDGYIAAREADIRDLAAVSQTPPQDFLGQIVNISAEALAAAEAGRTRKADERKHSFGESHEQVLRMAAHLMGDGAGAGDFDAQVVWKDVESRSLAQVADAFGKLASQLGVPAEMLWERIPGWTQQDVERAKRAAEAGGGIESLLRELTGPGMTPPNAAAGNGATG